MSRAGRSGSCHHPAAGGCVFASSLAHRQHQPARSEVAFLETERKIQSLAMSDMLTGLANRVSLRHALQVAIDRAGLNHSKLALLMIDLDRFKPINDRHGHMIGDLVLRQVAERISANLAVGDLRARYGGDE